MPLEYVCNHYDATLTVHLKGELTYTESETFQNLMDEVRQAPQGSCTLDLRGLKFIDSAGIGLLLMLKDRAGGKRTHLFEPRDQVAQVLALTKLETMFDTPPPASA